MRVYIDINDWWIGYYRGDTHHYACPLPTVVIRWNRSLKVEAKAEVERLRSVVADYGHRINWHTTCAGCAKMLDHSIRDYERAEAAEAETAALRERLRKVEALAAAVVAAWDASVGYEPCADCLRSGVSLIDFASDKALDEATDALRAALAGAPAVTPTETQAEDRCRRRDGDPEWCTAHADRWPQIHYRCETAEARRAPVADHTTGETR